MIEESVFSHTIPDSIVQYYVFLFLLDWQMLNKEHEKMEDLVTGIGPALDS